MGAPGLRIDAATRGGRFYLSDNGRAPIGPFTLPDVKGMIERGHCSSEVLMRPERDLGWMSYRAYLQKLRRERWRVLGLAVWQRIRPVAKDQHELAGDVPAKPSRAASFFKATITSLINRSSGSGSSAAPW